MDGRIPAAIGLFAAGIAVGLATGRTDLSAPLPLRPPRPAPVVGAKLVVDDACARDLSAARAELALCEKLAHDLDIEVHGVPMEWTAAVPAELQPDHVKERIERAIEECDVPVELLDWDCTEPPCFARMRSLGDWHGPLVGCPAWTEAYDNSMSMASASIECADGAEGMAFVSPHMEWLDEDEMENWGKRFQFRIDRAKETWPCRD